MTNDIFTREDQEFLIRNEALPKERIRAIETGGCPHAAIREDISANMGALEELQADFGCEMLFVESGGDNLAGMSLLSPVASLYTRRLWDVELLLRISGRRAVPLTWTSGRVGGAA